MLGAPRSICYFYRGHGMSIGSEADGGASAVSPGESKMYPEGGQDDTHLSVTGATSVARLAAMALQLPALPVAKHVRGVSGASQ